MRPLKETPCVTEILSLLTSFRNQIFFLAPYSSKGKDGFDKDQVQVSQDHDEGRLLVLGHCQEGLGILRQPLQALIYKI